MRPTLHLTFDGRCDAAFAFYARVLGGSVGYMLRDGSKIVHGSVTIAGVTVAGADVPAEQYAKPQGFFVLLDVKTPDEARHTFDALVEGGEVLMPLQATFWSPSFGALVDQFGVPWEISCEQAR
jgi:PhnB protein